MFFYMFVMQYVAVFNLLFVRYYQLKGLYITLINYMLNCT